MFKSLKELYLESNPDIKAKVEKREREKETLLQERLKLYELEKDLERLKKKTLKIRKKFREEYNHRKCEVLEKKLISFYRRERELEGLIRLQYIKVDKLEEEETFRKTVQEKKKGILKILRKKRNRKARKR